MARVPKRLAEAPTVAAFLSTPRDRYVVGPHFVYFQFGPKLTGYLLWGTPTTADFDQLERLIRASCMRLRSHPSLIDGRAMEGAPFLPFERLQMFVTANHQLLKETITTLAVVHGEGMSGAIFAGFFAVVEAPFPVVHVRTLEDGLARLGCASSAALAAELEKIRDDASLSPTFLRQARAAIESGLPSPHEDAIAQQLAVSRRTLQRRLSGFETTFKRELARARATRAVMQLELTNEPISSIALEVGCSSVSYLSVLVKRWTGLTPREIRARGRKQRRSPRSRKSD